MAEQAAQTTMMGQYLNRMRSDNVFTSDDLICGFQCRLESPARKWLGRTRRAGRWVHAEDVLQNALTRHLRAWESVRPESTWVFLGFAAEQMRRELLDLARHDYGLEGESANHCQGWTQAQVAERFRVDARTVRWCWESALVKLQSELQDHSAQEK